jgi:hypothetical protein
MKSAKNKKGEEFEVMDAIRIYNENGAIIRRGYIKEFIKKEGDLFITTLGQDPNLYSIDSLEKIFKTKWKEKQNI